MYISMYTWSLHFLCYTCICEMLIIFADRTFSFPRFLDFMLSHCSHQWDWNRNVLRSGKHPHFQILQPLQHLFFPQWPRCSLIGLTVLTCMCTPFTSQIINHIYPKYIVLKHEYNALVSIQFYVTEFLSRRRKLNIVYNVRVQQCEILNNEPVVKPVQKRRSQSLVFVSHTN